ncbi:MAG: hypothetical protein R3C19_04630 [Planctomycetaceae bacterium]
MSHDELPVGGNESFNPYAAPAAGEVALEGGSPAEVTRRKYLAHEAATQSIGSLYLLGGLAWFVVGVFSTAAAITDSDPQDPLLPLIAVALIVLGAGLIALAFGLRRLRRWARIPVVLLSVVGLIGFPIGTLVSAYILYLIFSSKGQTVFSDHYRDVIAATPHIQYRTSALSWVVLFAFLGLLAAGIVVPLLIG